MVCGARQGPGGLPRPLPRVSCPVLLPGGRFPPVRHPHWSQSSSSVPLSPASRAGKGSSPPCKLPSPYVGIACRQIRGLQSCCWVQTAVPKRFLEPQQLGGKQSGESYTLRVAEGCRKASGGFCKFVKLNSVIESSLPQGAITAETPERFPVRV